MHDKLKVLEESNRDNLEKLEVKIKMLTDQKKLENCKFGIECNRKFCKFDHSFVYRKINTRTEQTLKCETGDKPVEDKTNMRGHKENVHQPVQMITRQSIRFERSVFESKQNADVHAVDEEVSNVSNKTFDDTNEDLENDSSTSVSKSDSESSEEGENSESGEV